MIGIWNVVSLDVGFVGEASLLCFNTYILMVILVLFFFFRIENLIINSLYLLHFSSRNILNKYIL